MDRSELARLAGTSSKVIQRLNPGMRRFATQPDGVYTLLLPYNKINSFKNHLSALNAKTHVTWQVAGTRK
jgi:membrane-bound lytic murein transglycosylase D